MKVRKRIAALLRDPGDAVVRDTGQPFYLRLLAQWLEVFQDPDVDCLVNSSDSFATGVNVGVEDPLPRSPQVFPPKVKHRKLDDTEFNPIADIMFLGSCRPKSWRRSSGRRRLWGVWSPLSWQY